MKKKFLVCILLSALLFVGCNRNEAEGAPSGTPIASSWTSSAEPETEAFNLTDYAEYVGEDNDWTYALQKAVTNYDVIYIPAGTYKLSSVEIGASGKTIYGDGDNTVLIPNGKNLFNVSGGLGREIKISEPIEDFSNQIKVTNGKYFAEGDLVFLYGQRNCQIIEDCGEEWILGQSLAEGYTIYFGEYLRVESVEGNTLTTETDTIFPSYLDNNASESFQKLTASNPKYDDYLTKRESTTVQKVNAVENVVLRDFKVKGNAENCILFAYADNCRVENVSMEVPEDADWALGNDRFFFIKFRYSVDCVIEGCSFNALCELPEDTLKMQSGEYLGNYNIFMLDNCQRCGFKSCKGNLGTQIFAVGRTITPSIDCYVEGCEASGAIWAGINLANTNYRCSATGNRVSLSGHGIKVGCRESTVKGNTIDLSLPLTSNYIFVRPAEGGRGGIVINEGCSVDSVIEDNTVFNCYTGILVTDGYESTNIFYFGSVTVKNNTIMGCKQDTFLWKNTYNTAVSRFSVDGDF